MLLRVDGAAGPRNFILQPGAAPLVAGRGTDTDIRLPDALRSISRRHLSFALDGEGTDAAVRVVVVSEALGAWTSRGELPPGSHCRLKAGEHLVIGEYRISVLEHAPAPDGPAPAAASPQPPTPAAPPAPPASPPVAWAPAPARPTQSSPADDAMDLLGLIMPKEGAAEAVLGAGGHGESFRVMPVPAEPAPRAAVPLAGAPSGAPDAAARGAVARATGDGSQDVSAQDAVMDFLSGITPVAGGPGAPVVDTEPPAPLLVRMTPPDPLEWLEPVAPPPPSAAPPAPAATPPATDPADDLWSQLSHLAARVQGAPVPPMETTPVWDAVAPPAPATAPTPMPAPEATAPSSSPAGRGAYAQPTDPPRAEADACRALAQGLGIELPATLSEAEWQHIGATMKALVEGYASLLHARDSVRSTLGVPGRTELFSHDNNPLKQRVTPPVRLRLMALPQADERRYLPAPRAIAEATQDLQDHNMAIIAACRVAMEELVHSFDPQRWETAEAGGSGKRLPILGEAQLWRQYREHYRHQTQHMADLIQRLFEQHFVNAYARGLDRAREPAGSQKR